MIRFAEIKNRALVLSYVPEKDIEKGITFQFKKALTEDTLPFATVDIKKGQQHYGFGGSLKDSRNIKYIFIKQ